MSQTLTAEAPALRLGGKPASEGKTVRVLQRSDPVMPNATIFHEPWWLAAASDGAYREASVTVDNIITARLPYLPLRKFGGQTALVMPAMTHVLGPSITPDLPGGEVSRALREFSLCSELIEQLPKASHIWFAMHRKVTNTLPFEAAGFDLGVRFTSEIAPDKRDVIWRRMRDKTRNVIRRAEENLTVEPIEDATVFFEFYRENLRSRGQSSNYDLDLCRTVMQACIDRQRGRIIAAVDQTGAPQAAIFTAWDDEAEYYLMSTYAPNSGNGATSLLIWAALQVAAAEGRVFDMDGVHSNSNRLLITGFGGTLKPRYLVSTSSPLFQAAQFLKKTTLGRLRAG
ncbi:GNAT family N-acetyltransferase [Acidisoma cellulosilytica]|uniref:GNAT family N-acetyltransferase n=1 Tax=Acidisoma cellulosilyticum TaxID=2802395 RepID=A0A963Z3E8_9PROT|nr:GNAT family N-acetyltransferase [Acidisoma cellulosilyticum]MCB8881769.1 GNAT family N-acetyltransferase [Acidisoma cellulosilyticum]